MLAAQSSPSSLRSMSGNNPHAAPFRPASLPPSLLDAVFSAANDDDWSALCRIMGEYISLIEEGFCRMGKGWRDTEPQLKELWTVFYVCAKEFDYSSSLHDRLALHLIRIRSRGKLYRPTHFPGGPVPAEPIRRHDMMQVAMAPGHGFLWTDLPFLFDEMAMRWSAEFWFLESDQRVNLSSFFAKAASANLVDDKVYFFFFSLLREALEKPLAVDSNRLAILLPPTGIWFDEAGHKLIELSNASVDYFPAPVSSAGPLFEQSWLGCRWRRTGFTPGRWLFWLQRLDQIENEAIRMGLVGPDSIAKMAADAMHCMLSQVELRNTWVLKELENHGNLIRDQSRLSLRKRYQ
ncbi:hypothetical protein XA68_13600 [Ophiocordyceps unilateralis]|uniref:Uncharacterized protein n=1 Tax=Ophiocordyceps unilateralis TaxID=268505 RepID=A0A2A9PC43_OPHUN|nr:hypothetical protein XA68_13600 [Ophiocordyceps unilateralis]